MNRVAVTIVDFMAFLIPGVVVLFGLVLLPLPQAWLVPLNDSLIRRIPLLSYPWVAGGCWLVSAYVLGFLLRLVSIELMNVLTSHKWVSRVEREANELSSVIKTAIKDDKLAE